MKLWQYNFEVYPDKKWYFLSVKACTLIVHLRKGHRGYQDTAFTLGLVVLTITAEQYQITLYLSG